MKFVAISDTHLGQRDGDAEKGYYSLLSPSLVQSKPDVKKTLTEFAARISEFANGDKIALIGVGDIMDLSLTPFKTCLMELEDFLEYLPSVERFYYIIGNHDHHVWTLNSENKLLVEPLIEGNLPLGDELYIPFDKYDGFQNDILSHYFESKGVLVSLHYPSLSFDDYNMHFTHGHLCGGMYTFFSDVLKPFLPEDIIYERVAATVNAPIIEFIYWWIGQTGERMGADGVIETLWTDLQLGKDESLIRKALNSFVSRLFPNGIIRGFPDAWERAIVRWSISHILDQLMTKRRISSMDRHSTVENNNKKVFEWKLKCKVPQEVSIISGHTHTADYSEVLSPIGKYDIYNLGSWLVEPDHLKAEPRALFVDGDKKEFISFNLGDENES